MYHLEVEQAFSCTDVDYEVCTGLTHGCGSMSFKVVLLGQSVYGLTQAGSMINALLV